MLSIDLAPIQQKLEIIEEIIPRLEYSGFGWVQRIGQTFLVYDFELLNVGFEDFTEIPTAQIMPLIDRVDNANMKLWLHRHPMGNGVPGPHNWSPQDEYTATQEPMGGLPEMVGWSAAVVHTLKGWVGRIDNHKSGKTVHVPVTLFDEAATEEIAFELRDEFYAHNPTYLGRKKAAWDPGEYYGSFDELQSEFDYRHLEPEQKPQEEPTWTQSLFDWVRSKK